MYPPSYTYTLLNISSMHGALNPKWEILCRFQEGVNWNTSIFTVMKGGAASQIKTLARLVRSKSQNYNTFLKSNIVIISKQPVWETQKWQ